MPTETELRRDGLEYGLFPRSREAVAWLAEAAPPPARVRVVGDDDCDGATSVHVISTALRRAGYETTSRLRPVHTAAQARDAVRGPHDLCVIADAGSAFLPDLDAEDVPVLVLDHHDVVPHEARNVFEVNPRRVGGDRTWHVSASVVSAVFAHALAARNADLAYAGLAGGISDRQHLGGLHGLMDYLVDLGVTSGALERGSGFTLPGATVVEAIASSLDPYFPEYAGDAAALGRDLDAWGVASDAPPHELAPEPARRLAGHLDARLRQRSTAPDRYYPLHAEALRLRHGTGVPTVFAISRLLEAATAMGEYDMAARLLAGSPEAHDEARILSRHRQRALIDEVARMRGAIETHARFRHVETRDGDHTGVYAHTLLTYVTGDDRPLLVTSPDGPVVRASARGSPRLFLDAGLDLARAMRQAARAAQGTGGGHPGAAGATFPRHEVGTFLQAFDDVLGTLRAGAGA